MPPIANFTAWIQVDGESLPEYGIKYSEDGEQVTCWIPSEIAKQFAICVKDSERSYPSATTVYVDGTRCKGKVIHGNATHPRRTAISTQYGVKISDGSYRPFMFSKCDLVEDEDVNIIQEVTSPSSELGSIKVVVDEVKTYSHIKAVYNLHELPPLQVNEKLKKGIVHGTQLGAEIRSKTRQPRRTSKLRRVATFIFQYRPFAVLQAADLALPSIKRDDPAYLSSHEAHNLVNKEEDHLQITDAKREDPSNCQCEVVCKLQHLNIACACRSDDKSLLG